MGGLMPRKTLLDVDPQLKAAAEQVEALSVIRVEMARDLYAVQDELTQRTIDRVVATLRQHATGTVNAVVNGSIVPIKVSDETLGFNLFWLGCELVKDLGSVGIKIANFKFDPKHCASCGTEVQTRKKTTRR
jgi:hypothetical protein